VPPRPARLLTVAAAAACLAAAGCGVLDDTAGAPAAAAGPPERAVAGQSQVPSDERRLERVDRITGELTPKSVVASGDGLVVAQNMIYTHTVSAFSSEGELVGTIDDAVTPSEYGYEEWTGVVKGGPVEAAFSPDRRHLWVSNYSMYGPGFARDGDDTCSPDMGIDDSFLYRIDAETLEIDDIALVGAVPKYVDVTPDGRYVLATNWCTWDLSVVDTQADGGPEEVATVDIGRYPRGIAVSPDSSTAYVAMMGASHVAVVDLAAAVSGAGDAAVTDEIEVGRGPRHLNISPDGATLYATLNHVGRVAKVDLASGRVLATVATGAAPRSAALSPDGTALFVVNYESDTVSRVRTSDMEVLESVDVDHHPIGVTYDAHLDRVWVAAYVGSLTVFADRPAG
jgi:YVTN family beta-propeller protein